MKALQEQKLVLLCVRPARRRAKRCRCPPTCATSPPMSEYAKTTKVVPLHLGDAAEMVLLKSLQIDPQTATPLTVLMAPPAAVIGSYADEVTKDELVAKLKARNRAVAARDAVAIIDLRCGGPGICRVGRGAASPTKTRDRLMVGLAPLDPPYGGFPQGKF